MEAKNGSGDGTVKNQVVNALLGAVDTVCKGPQPMAPRNLDFATAFTYLMAGNKVTRAIWRGYIIYAPDAQVTTFTGEGKGQLTKIAAGIILAHKADGTFAPSMLYQEDLLAKDWLVVG